MAGPSLKLGAEEFEKSGRRKKKEKPSRTGKFYKKHIAPRRKAIALALVGAGIIGYGMFKGISCAGSMSDSGRAQKAEEAWQEQERITPKPSLKLSVKGKHDGNGKLSAFNIHETQFEIDGCPIGTHALVLEKREIDEIGQGIYKLTVTLMSEAHGQNIRYRFSFEIDDNDYDFMPVEATLVQ